MKKTPITTTIEAHPDVQDPPEGWTLASTLDLFTFVTSGSRGWAKYYAQDGALFLRIANLDHNTITIDFSEKKFVQPPSSSEGTRTRVQMRDLLISITADVGMIGLVAEDPGEAYINQHIALARPAQWLDDRYLAWYLTSRQGQEQLRELQRGATKVGLGLDDIQSVDVPLAPIQEQHRIVRELEKLFAQVQQCRTRLACVPRILQQFRQSVLAAACSGSLTEDWRDKNPKEPVEVTIRTLLQERKYTTGSQRRRRPNVGDQVTPLFKIDRWPATAGSLLEIPDSWAWVYLPDLGFMNRGTSRHRPRNAPHLYGGRHPFIQTGDVARSGGRIESYEQTYSPAGLAQSRLWPAGTVCVTIAANIAASALLTCPACFPDSIVGIIANPELSLGEYLEYFIRTARSDLAQFAPATAQANINIAILNNVAVPTPPLEEQCEIVRRVNALFTLADKIEKRVAAVTNRADKLTQSILAKAFRGELVPTEAELARREARNYESAAFLLARIHAERKGAKATNGTRRRVIRKNK